MKKLLSALFFLGLMYILWPGPNVITDFPPLPGSFKSYFPGDTYQNPNIAAYYSDFERMYVTQYYRNFFEKSNFWIFVPTIRLNHAPELAYQYIRDQQESTYLEEFTYPLRVSLFVNGYEPKIENQIYHRVSGFLGNHIELNNHYYVSKTTIRYYPTPILWRIVVYIGIWGCLYLLWYSLKVTVKRNNYE